MATSVHVSPRTAAIPLHALYGAAAGLARRHRDGHLDVDLPADDGHRDDHHDRGLLGSTNAFVGWLIHLAIAVFAGTGFGVLLGQYAQKMGPAGVLGLVYGAVWWTLGARGSCPPTCTCRSSPGTRSAAPAWAHLVYRHLAGLAFSCIAQVMAKRTATAGR